MNEIIYKEIKTQSQNQGRANNIERVFLHRCRISLAFVNLDGGENEDAKDRREKPPGELPLGGSPRGASRVVGLALMGGKMLEMGP